MNPGLIDRDFFMSFHLEFNIKTQNISDIFYKFSKTNSFFSSPF